MRKYTNVLMSELGPSYVSQRRSRGFKSHQLHLGFPTEPTVHADGTVLCGAAVDDFGVTVAVARASGRVTCPETRARQLLYGVAMGMRRRSRRRGLIVGAAAGAAVAHHRGRGEDEGQQAPEQVQYAPEPAQYAPAPADPADELEHLAQLHTSGVLTDDEFASAKAKVLGS
jgi:Short C-terminal domain